MSYWHTASFVAACDTFYALYAKPEENPRWDYNVLRRLNAVLAQTPRRSPMQPIRALYSRYRTPIDGETIIRTLYTINNIIFYRTRWTFSRTQNRWLCITTMIEMINWRRCIYRKETVDEQNLDRADQTRQPSNETWATIIILISTILDRNNTRQRYIIR